jgi:hypothetical protein
VAGCKTKDGYRRIRIYKILYLAHRLAWLYKFEKFPPIDIDHINHNRLDNRILNLRSVNRSDNMKNGSVRCDNKSGVAGVHWSKQRKKWQVTIGIGEKNISLGRFSNKEEAVKIRKDAEKKYRYHKNYCQFPSFKNK